MKAERTVYWTEKNLRITRLRLLSDPGIPFWDVSYCDGVILHEDGTREPVMVSLPFSQLARTSRYLGQLRRAPSLARQIIEYGKKDGVFVKRLGVLDVISTLC